MFLEASTKIKSYLTSVIIQKIKNITIIRIIWRWQNERGKMWRFSKGFVGLKSKMYTFITEHNHESEKAQK